MRRVRKPMLIKAVSGKESKSSNCVVGIAGAQKGVGSTHTAIMVAHYFAKYKRLKCAVLEMNGSEDFLHVQSAAIDGYNYEEVKQFQLMGVAYFPNETEAGLVARLNEDYDCYIIDFGMLTHRNQNEYLRCDVKLALGSLAEWKRHQFYSFVNSNRHLKGFHNWKLCIVFGQAKDLLEDGRQLKVPLWSIGYNPDPFLLNGENMKLFHQLFANTFR